MIREIICFCLLRPMKRDRKLQFGDHWLSVADFIHVDRYTLPSKRDIIDIETCKLELFPRQGSYLPERLCLDIPSYLQLPHIRRIAMSVA